ncbi:MAG: GatB/YqeY domain-containing protein [Candidatus Berkelbacteria bacterium]|nr:GatB/YqeY domain-containing protein [Candidatus Berkelbacteria bacterium]
MLIKKIDENLKSAMKKHNDDVVSVLRMLKSAIKNFEIQKKDEATDEEVLKVIQKEIKQRRDSIESYLSNNRPESAEKEKTEVAILTAYLPEQLSDADLTANVQKAIDETGATGMADIGKVMAVVMPQVAGQADGSQVSAKVRELIAKNG